MKRMTMKEINAKAGKLPMFKVSGFDSFSHEDFPVGEYSTKAEALKVAKEKSGQMTLMYVYDQNGKQIAKFGSW